MHWIKCIFQNSVPVLGLDFAAFLGQAEQCGIVEPGASCSDDTKDLRKDGSGDIMHLLAFVNDYDFETSQN